MNFKIIKASGKKEIFDPNKFRKSLQRAGASKQIIEQITRAVEEDPSLRTTHAIYAFALQQLHAQSPATATHYNIKRALYELGPAGFPFEKFIAGLFSEQGYTTQTNQIIQGKCVTHEVDVIARSEDKHFYIECKFHSRQGLPCDVKVPLYVKARVDDIIHADDKKKYPYPQGWLVTNTRFTSDAIAYGECAGLNLLSWSHPVGNSIPDLMARHNAHPITALISLSNRQKRLLMQKGVILCRDIPQHTALLHSLGMSSLAVENIINEANMHNNHHNK